MAKVELSKGRAIIDEQPHGIEIVIPTKKNYFLILFLGFWIVGWAFGEVSAINTLLNGESTSQILFLIIWLGAWTVGGGFAFFIWVWNLKGKEIIRITNKELQYIKNFVVFSRSKEYEINNIKNLRIDNKANSIFNFNAGLEFWGLTGGAIAFDYGYSTHKFGSCLDEAEAKNIVETITARYKNL